MPSGVSWWRKPTQSIWFLRIGIQPYTKKRQEPRSKGKMLGKHLHECNNYMYKKVVICFHHFSEYFKDEKTVDSKFLKLKSVRICSVLYITLSIKCFSHLLIWNNLVRYSYRWKPKNPGSTVNKIHGILFLKLFLWFAWHMIEMS